MPYAIIKTGGKQFRVEPGRTYKIPSLEGEEGGAIEFNDVLLGNDGKAVKTGVPSLKGASVTGEIVRHGRGEKIIVFKQKRRKNYARKRGHRQGFTDDVHACARSLPALLLEDDDLLAAAKRSPVTLAPVSDSLLTRYCRRCVEFAPPAATRDACLRPGSAANCYTVIA